MTDWRPRGIPAWVKVAFTAWLVVWVAVYWPQYGPANFLWLCDAANFVVAAALWLESSLLISAQAVSVLIISALWMIDFFSALLFGVHPIGGTEYMFLAEIPLPIRLLSLFHVAVPVLLVWALRRLGYDRRGWKLQAAIAWVILPVSFLVGDAERNLNWLWRPFETVTGLPPAAHLALGMVLVPLVLYVPTHFVLARTMPLACAKIGSRQSKSG